jgi:hypothetical protein
MTGIEHKGEKERQRERGLGRERDNGFGERKRCGTFEKMALVDFDRWSKSTLGYFWRRQSIEQ